MSTVTATAGRTRDELVAKQRRLNRAKGVIAFLFALILLYFGYRGRGHALLQVALSEITGVCDQLQRKLDDAAVIPEQLPISGNSSAPQGHALASSNPEVAELANTLKTQLRYIDAHFSRGQMSKEEDLEIRLTEATLANSEGRFADAFAALKDAGDSTKPSMTDAVPARLARVIHVRADAAFGLNDWRAALDQYRQVLDLDPNRLAARARLADCYDALGNKAAAFAAWFDLAMSFEQRGDRLLVDRKMDAAVGRYARASEILSRLTEPDDSNRLAAELAASHNAQGNAFLLLGKPPSALDQYEKGVEILTRLDQKDGRDGPAHELAFSHVNLGNAFLAQSKPDASVGHFENAVQILAALSGKDGQSRLTNELGVSHTCLGNALLAQGKHEAAIGHYDQAIELQGGIIGQGEASERAIDLAVAYNNRGVVRRAQGKLEAALGDFDQAITVLARQVQNNKSINSSASPDQASRDHPLRVKLVVALGYSEKSIEVITRPRLVGHGGPTETSVALAMSLKNRGYGYLSQGKLDSALADFKESMQIYSRLVEQQGEKDLAPQFARSLSPIAWIYATNPDASFRDGAKAKAYALRACELSNWKAVPPIETLAAACAETGDFAEAAKWQQKALELAPANQRGELRARLELYNSGKPYRLPKRGESRG